MANEQRSQWGSRLGFLMAAVGSAVGLGSIWKFPYMTGEGGGSAFVILFIICITLVGFPTLIAEWMIGRRIQKSPIDSFRGVATSNGRSKHWGLLGVVGTLAAFLILSFYSVIGGWSLNYVIKSLTGQFTNVSADQSGDIFGAMLANPTELTLWHSLFMLATAVIVAGGIAGGIERAAKWLMPFLAVIMTIIVGYNMMTMDFMAGVNYLFNFDASKITGKVLISALGHAFFCLSLGMAIMVSYGSYLKRDIDLIGTARTVVIWDIIFSLMAGLAIFPIIFSTNLDPAGGPGLIFVTLPIAFGQMGMGLIIGTLFFVLLSFAALTSSISILEPVVAFLTEKVKLKRQFATISAAIAAWGLGILALLSFNVLSDVTIFTISVNGESKPQGIFDALDYSTSKIMLPLVGLGTLIFLGWFVDTKGVKDELGLNGTMWSAWQITVKFIAPLAVILVFLAELGLLGVA